jgi:hypothetical protein
MRLTSALRPRRASRDGVCAAHGVASPASSARVLTAFHDVAARSETLTGWNGRRHAPLSTSTTSARLFRPACDEYEYGDSEPRNVPGRGRPHPRPGCTSPSQPPRATSPRKPRTPRTGGAADVGAATVPSRYRRARQLAVSAAPARRARRSRPLQRSPTAPADAHLDAHHAFSAGRGDARGASREAVACLLLSGAGRG